MNKQQKLLLVFSHLATLLITLMGLNSPYTQGVYVDYCLQYTGFVSLVGSLFLFIVQLTPFITPLVSRVLLVVSAVVTNFLIFKFNKGAKSNIRIVFTIIFVILNIVVGGMILVAVRQ